MEKLPNQRSKRHFFDGQAGPNNQSSESEKEKIHLSAKAKKYELCIENGFQKAYFTIQIRLFLA